MLPNALPYEEAAQLRERTLSFIAAARTVPRGAALREDEGVVRKLPPHRMDTAEGAFLLRSLVNVPHSSLVHPILGQLEAVAQQHIFPGFPGWRMAYAGHADLQANTAKRWHRDSPTPKRGWKGDPQYASYSPFKPWGAHGAEHRLYRMIVYLDDHHEDNGALLVMPRSHTNSSIRPPKAIARRHALGADTSGRVPNAAVDDAADPRVRVLRPRLGDALVIDHRVLHRGGDMGGPVNHATGRATGHRDKAVRPACV